MAKPEPGRTGTAFICATPIGNLEDITLRALRVLGEVDLIAAEDTRRTRKLLTHYQIPARLISFHEHNERLVLPKLMARLKEGRSIAVVSDAGMPGIADPGHRLVRACIEEGVKVAAIPGPSALITAAVLSGLPTHDIRFLGFLPRRSGQRRVVLESVKDQPSTLLLFEAPHRLKALLGDVLAVLGDRRLAILRELTKQFEEYLRGSTSQLLEIIGRREPKGEIVVAIAGWQRTPAAVDTAQLQAEVEELIRVKSLTRRQAARQVAGRHGLPTRRVYQATAPKSNK